MYNDHFVWPDFAFIYSLVVFLTVVYVLAKSDTEGTAISGAKHAPSSSRRGWYACLKQAVSELACARCRAW